MSAQISSDQDEFRPSFEVMDTMNVDMGCGTSNTVRVGGRNTSDLWLQTEGDDERLCLGL